MILDTLPIERIPRIRTARAKSVSTTPVSQVGISKLVLRAAAIEFACVILPIPKEAQTAKKAKSAAIARPRDPPIPFFTAITAEDSPFTELMRRTRKAMAEAKAQSVYKGVPALDDIRVSPLVSSK